jgi:CheY-specific phosphatase CheX
MSEFHPETRLPPEVIEAFISSALIALQELAHCEAVPGGLATPPLTFPGNSTIAAMRLLRRLPGTLTLIVPAEVAFHLARGYLPEGADLTHDIVDDVVGEFANVIAGQTKTVLKGSPYHFALSLPAVSRAPYAADVEDTALVLITPAGPLWLVVALPPCDGA